MITVVDLKETRISVPEIGWHKSKMVESKLEFSAIFSESGIEKIQSLSVTGGGVKLKGTAELEDKNFFKFNLINLKYGDLSVSGDILHKIISDGEFRTKFDFSVQLNSKHIRENFNLKPAGIVKTLDLLKPRYLPTAAYGHFGRKELSFTWEKTDKVKAIKKSAKI